MTLTLPAQVSRSQSATVPCHFSELAGFSTQWFSSGKVRNSLRIPLVCAAAKAASPCSSGMR